MTEEALEARVGAIERAFTDGHELADLPDGAALAARVDALEERADAVESRLDELEAATLAVRGYVGNIRAVNRDVERRADAALAAVERLTADDGPLRAPNGDPITGPTDSRRRSATESSTMNPGERSPHAEPSSNAERSPQAERSSNAERARSPHGDAPADAAAKSRSADERDSPVPERILSRVRGSL